MTAQWIGFLVATAVAAGVACVLEFAVASVLRARGAGSSSGVWPTTGRADGERADLVDAEEGIVRCPDCGTKNELGYRFCRECAAKLPGAARGGRSGAPPWRRDVR